MHERAPGRGVVVIITTTLPKRFEDAGLAAWDDSVDAVLHVGGIEKRWVSATCRNVTGR